MIGPGKRRTSWCAASRATFGALCAICLLLGAAAPPGENPRRAASNNSPASAERSALASESELPEPLPETPREFFNTGTRNLKQGKLREAESFLESSLFSQEPKTQVPALYNLGWVRFEQGKEELKKGPAAAPSLERSKVASAAAQGAIQDADAALAGDDIQRMVGSYIRGRGARKDLRQATEVVKRALKAFGTTLSKWQRASGDFKGAQELQPGYKEAAHNADVVDRNIAKLIDSLRELEQAAAAMGQKKEELGEKLKQLKGRIPEQDMPPGASGDDEEEEEDQPQGQQDKPQEGPMHEGEERPMSPEEASWLLDGFKLNGDRRLPMGEKETSKPRDRNRPTW